MTGLEEDLFDWFLGVPSTLMQVLVPDGQEDSEEEERLKDRLDEIEVDDMNELPDVTALICKTERFVRDSATEIAAEYIPYGKLDLFKKWCADVLLDKRSLRPVEYYSYSSLVEMLIAPARPLVYATTSLFYTVALSVCVEEELLELYQQQLKLQRPLLNKKVNAVLGDLFNELSPDQALINGLESTFATALTGIRSRRSSKAGLYKNGKLGGWFGGAHYLDNNPQTQTTYLWGHKISSK